MTSSDSAGRLRAYLPRLLTPGSLAGRLAGVALEIACIFVLLALAFSDLTTPVNVTVSAVAVFPVLAAAWWLSLRATVEVTVIGVLLQILLFRVASIDGHDAIADIAAMLRAITKSSQG